MSLFHDDPPADPPAPKPTRKRRNARASPAGASPAGASPGRDAPAGKSTRKPSSAEDFPDPGRVAIWGRSGSGKSAYAKAMVRDVPRLVVFDVQDEYEAQGFERVSTVDQVKRAIQASPARYRLALVPRSGDEPGRLNSLAEIMTAANATYAQSRNKLGMQSVLMVEELNSAFRLHSGESAVPFFSALCSRGRRKGVGLIGISQRPAEISMRFRGNCSEVVCFSMASDTDAAAVMKTMRGVSADELLNLAPHEYVRINRATLEVTRGRNNLR